MTQAEDSEQAVTERGDDEAHMQPNRTEELQVEFAAGARMNSDRVASDDALTTLTTRKTLQSLRNGFPPGYTEEPEGEAGDRTEPSAAREGAPAAQDNSKQEGDEFPRPPDSAGPPLTQGGDRCLAELEIPKDQVESILHQIRVEIIEEMEAFADRSVLRNLTRPQEKSSLFVCLAPLLCRRTARGNTDHQLRAQCLAGAWRTQQNHVPCRTDGEAKEWSATEVEEVTEELDENLRKHRPRAGCAGLSGSLGCSSWG